MISSNVQGAGLQRIVLINSYIGHGSSANRVFEFDLSKHTQINGANGSGKTSLLKLIPLFYGIVPGKITSSSNVHKSFSGFYLPDSDSTIVFEYRNSRGETVHVMMNNASQNANNKSINYRFVKGAFDVENFVVYDESIKRYRAKTWQEYKKYLKLSDIQSETLVTTVDQYRSIIQNISNGTNNQLRYDYSLCSGKKHLRYIEGITQSLITGHVKFDSIKLLLTDILRQNHPNINLALNQSSINEWCNDVRAYREAEKQSDNLRRILALHEKTDDSINLLSSHLAHLNWFRNNFKENIDKINTEIEQKTKSRDEFNSIRDEEIRNIQYQITEIDSNLHKVLKDIQAIEDQQSEFTEKDAMYWESQYDNKIIVEHGISQIKDKLSSVSAVYNNIKGEFDAKKAEAEKRANTEISALEKKKNEAKLDIQNKIHELETTHQNSLNKLNQDRNARINEIDIKITSIKGEISKLESELKNIPIPEEKQKRLIELNQRYTEVHKINSELNEKLYKTSNEIQKLSQERDSLISNCEKIQTKKKNIEVRLNEIANLLNPDTGMLSGYLNEYEPNWKQSIGKVIREDLLSRNDLLPQKANDSSEEGRINIGSLSLSIGKLPSCQGDSNELENEQKELTQKLSDLTSQFTANTKNSENMAQQISQLQSEATVLESQKISEQEITDINNQIKISKDDIDTFKKNQILAIQNVINTNKNDLHKLESEKKEIDKTLSEHIKTQNDNYFLNKSDLETERDNVVSDSDTRIQELQNDCKKTIKELNAIMLQKMNNEKVDQKLIDSLTNELEQKQQTLDGIMEHEKFVNDYRTWKNTSFSHLAEYRLKQNELEPQLNKLNNDKNALEEDQKRQDKNYQNQIVTLKREVNETNQKLTNTEGLIERVIRSEVTSQINEARETDITFENTYHDTDEQIKKYEDNIKDLDNCINAVKNCMNGLQESSIKTFWIEACSEKSLTTALPSDDLDDSKKNRIIYPEAAKKMLEGELKQIKRNLMDSTQNILHMIKQYYDHMMDFDRRIKGFSNRISNTVSNNLQFEAFESFNISLEPCIKKLVGWNFIHSLADFYNEWLDNDRPSGNLPSEEYVQKLSALSDMFVNGMLHNDLNELFNIIFTVTENGKQKIAKTEKDLEDISSNGLTFLLLCALYISLIHESRDGLNIAIHWPVDEMSKLSAKNIRLLLNVMEKNNIVMLSAAPDLSPTIAMEFDRIYRIAKDRVYVNAEALDPIKSAINSRLNEESQENA